MELHFSRFLFAPLVLVIIGVTSPGISVGRSYAQNGSRPADLATQSDGAQSITYLSSVDGEPLTAVLWIPEGFDPEGDPVPLLVYLHGGGGNGTVLLRAGHGALTAELDARGWIGIAPDGRRWGLANQGCRWPTSAAYVDNPDPNVGPGEQDILDAVDWAVANFPVDTDRIYLAGSSMGGRGTYIIGLKNPDRFAAIAPLMPAIDMYEIFVRRPEPSACKEGMTGGKPGDSPFVDTMYTITSGRFLIENAYNLPVYHGHGFLDHTANNDSTNAPFLHGWHITTDTSWDECHGSTDLCFGHTPTLSELQDRHPDGYDWAFMFTPVGHTVDRTWIEGTAAAADVIGVEDPQNPGHLIGMMEFFDRHSLQQSPDTIVYKSYTDTHRTAYWTTIDITTPWQDLPGAIRARRDRGRNSLEVELVRVATATFDLPLAKLRVAPGDPLTIAVRPLVEPVFDPALATGGPSLEPRLVLRGDFMGSSDVTVLRDGTPLPDAMVDVNDNSLTIGPITIEAPTVLTIDLSS